MIIGVIYTLGGIIAEIKSVLIRFLKDTGDYMSLKYNEQVGMQEDNKRQGDIS